MTKNYGVNQRQQMCGANMKMEEMLSCSMRSLPSKMKNENTIMVF